MCGEEGKNAEHVFIPNVLNSFSPWFVLQNDDFLMWQRERTIGVVRVVIFLVLFLFCGVCFSQICSASLKTFLICWGEMISPFFPLCEKRMRNPM